MVYPRQILYTKNILSFFQLNKKENVKSNIDKFQTVFCKVFKTKKVLPIAMGRLGIYFACKEISDTNKNEIILSPFTIFDIVNMILSSNSKPVFCDIERNSNHLSLSSIKKKITKKNSSSNYYSL